MWRETTMDVAKLGQRQLFGMKKENLFKRVLRSFEQNQQAAEVVEYLVAILVRHSLCISDFSLQPLKELIHELFLTATPNDTLRQHCVYFQHLFSDEEWQTVTQRLFSSKEEYQASTKEACSYKKLLEKKSREHSQESDFQFDLISVFKDAAGKKHTWTLRDTKPITSPEETAEVLNILTTLTIFQTSGVRRFAEYVKFKSKKSCLDAEHEAVPANAEEPVQETTNKQETPRKKNAQQELSTAKNTTATGKVTQQKNQPAATKSKTEPSTKSPTAKSKNAAGKSNLPKSERPPAKNAAANLENSDASDKNEDQIQQRRNERRAKNRIEKFLKRKKKK